MNDERAPYAEPFPIAIQVQPGRRGADCIASCSRWVPEAYGMPADTAAPAGDVHTIPP